MSLLGRNGFAHDYLSAEVPEGAVLVEDEVDVEGVDTNEVVFVDGIGAVMPEEVYQLWPEGAVAVEPIGSDEQIESQTYLSEGENIYDDQQYEYVQTEELPADGSQMGEEDLHLECSLPARYVDANGLGYVEEDVIPVEHPDVVEFQVDEGEGLVNRRRRKPPTVIQCEVCGVVVKHPSKIEVSSFDVELTCIAHMRTHTGEKPFECEICGAKFTQRTPMLNHVRRHLGQTPYACGYGCGKSFVNNAQKKAHELRHMGEKRSGPPRPHLKPPKRQIWNKSLSKGEIRPRQVEEERSTMVDFAPPVGQIERPISAAASKRWFSFIEFLSKSIHITILRLDEVIESVVSGIPIKKKKSRSIRAPLIVQCQVCGLMLKHASKIKAHIRTHTGDRPYLCAHCFASFNTSGTLAMHIKRKHMTERPYSCTWDCGRRFVSISTRNEHERVVHAGTKRYECTVPGCRRMFTRRCYLMLHRQREHGLIFKPIFDPQVGVIFVLHGSILPF
ncbi:zinc finger, C2H2 type [Oesophagostomum dentatum]|uniref:Zinc finger, C2H2 type n=1 Tax=Oesophagostomum dentatum TaxID=61180 RepID=A0A0B1TB88_OESDE|nr:zinc finger, C2H2 type [Oesophagostomum dentatum]